MTAVWQRDEAEDRIREVLDAAMRDGTQQVLDADGTFRITFEKRRGTLEELFSKPGPISDDEQTV